MAGALTANGIATANDDSIVTDEETVIATIEFLSPVEGANNALLTALCAIAANEDDDEVTFQWYRAAPSPTVANTVVGAAVGDPFTVDVVDSGGTNGQICVQAIDRGAGLTSGYALGVIGVAGDIVAADAIYVDAVLYD